MGHTDDPKDGKAVAQVSTLSPYLDPSLTLYNRLYSVQQPSTQLSSCFVGVRYVESVITRLSVDNPFNIQLGAARRQPRGAVRL